MVSRATDKTCQSGPDYDTGCFPGRTTLCTQCPSTQEGGEGGREGERERARERGGGRENGVMGKDVRIRVHTFKCDK